MGTKVYDNYQDLITFNRNSKGTALRPIGYGDELVVNGTFDTDTTGWAPASATLSVASNTLRVTATASYGQALQQVSVVVGKVYKVEITAIAGTAPARPRAGTTAGDNSIWQGSTTSSGSLTETFVFKASSTSLFLGLYAQTTTVGQYADYDNISVKEVLFDRDGDPLTLFLHPAGVPRIEYGADRNLKGLLIEPTAQNYDTASSTVLNWSVINITRSYDQTTAPDGVASTADQVLETVDNNPHAIFKDYTLAAGSYIFSCFVKSIGGRNFQLLIQEFGGGGSGGGTVQFNLSTGTVVSGTGTITEIGDGWYRVSGSAVTAGATGIRVIAYSINGTSSSFAGDITKGFYLWGAQVETGPIATSYMPTTGSPFTRDKDDASMTNVSGLIGQKEGTLYAEVDWRGTSGTGQFLFGVSDGTDNNRIQFYKYSLDNFIYRLVKAGGSNVFDTSVESSTGYSGIQKFAFAYADGDFELYRNGSSKSTGTGSLASLATLTDIDLGQRHNAIQQANMHIRAVQIIPRRLSDAQLIELTS